MLLLNNDQRFKLIVTYKSKEFSRKNSQSFYWLFLSKKPEEEVVVNHELWGQKNLNLELLVKLRMNYGLKTNGDLIQWLLNSNLVS